MVTEAINSVISTNKSDSNTDADTSHQRMSIDEYYNAHLKSLEDEFKLKEDKNQEQYQADLPTIKRRAIPASLLFLAICYGFYYLDLFQSMGWIISSILLVIIGFALLMGMYWGLDSPDSFNDELAERVFPVIFRYFGDDFVCSKSCPWKVETVSGSGIFPPYVKEATEDYLSGTYKSVAVEMVEVKLEQRSSNVDGHYHYTVFNGLLLILTPKKQYSGHIVIKRDKAAGFNIFTSMLRKEYKHLESVKLEDPIFEKKFEVFADDQIAARTILTTSFMQRLLDLEEKVDSNGRIECSFYKGKLQIAIPTGKNYFKPISQYWEEIDFKRELQRINADVEVVFDIIDTLKLDMDIGL